MTSEKYWDERALKRLNDVEIQSDEHIKRIKKIYTRANRDIKKQIANIYKNYSKETGIDIQTLKTLLSKKETDKFWKSLEGKGLKQYVLDNYKARINRLEQLQGQLYARAKEVYGDELSNVYGHYRAVINESYNKTIYDTQIGTGYDFSFNKLDDKTINAVLNAKWHGGNYSTRIWGNTNILADRLSEILGGALISGQSMSKTIMEVKNAFDVGKYYAERLVRTETNHFNAEAEALAYEELGVERYVFVATLDNRTSEKCQNHDGKVYSFKDKKTGVNYPPLHPNCRSTTRGYLGEEEEKMLKRRAKNPITGETEIIDNISYKDWIKQHQTVEKVNEKVQFTNLLTINDKIELLNNSNSIKELNDNAMQVLSNTKINKIDFTNGDLRKSKEILVQYTKLVNEYNTDPTHSITLEKLKRSVEGQVSRIGYKSDCTIQLKNIEYIEPNKYQEVKSSLNFNSVVDKENNNIYILTHEFAHTLSTSKQLPANKDVEFWAEIKKIKTAYSRELSSIDKKLIVEKTINREQAEKLKTEIHISEYAKTNLDEFMAEAFAEAKLSSNPSKYSIEVLKVVDKYFKKR